MPRANRHFLPGYIWHITHRCHGREFLLDDESDRNHWLSLLRKAKKRFRMNILGYCVTCNHIHLLVEDTGDKQSIARSMQLVQGQFAQSFNRRTGRINAFWGDRYSATAIDSGIHLIRCLAYIDLNMVRAGAVTHPSQWHHCGYNELFSRRTREGIINIHRLAALLDCADVAKLKQVYARIIDESLCSEMSTRDDKWTESLAIGSQSFTELFASRLGKRLGNRAVTRFDKQNSFAVCENFGVSFYGMRDEPESIVLRGENLVEIHL
ncbi:MAG: transposase [Chitinispirillaceae bacterium]